jgi:hypothetical protein
MFKYGNYFQNIQIWNTKMVRIEKKHVTKYSHFIFSLTRMQKFTTKKDVLNVLN